MEQTQQNNPQSPQPEEKAIVVDQIGEAKAGEAEGERRVEVLHDKLQKRFAAKREAPAPEQPQEATEVVEEAPVVVEEEKKLTKLEVAARKERKAHEERVRAQKERQEIERQRAEMQEAIKLAKAKEAKDYDALLDGVDETELYTKLTKKYIGGEMKKPAEENKLSAIEERLAAAEERESRAQYERAVSLIGAEMHKAAEKYPYTLTTGSEHVVYDVILEHYRENQRTLTWEEAAEITERFLESEHESKAQIRDKVRASKVKTSPEPEKAPKPQSKTLTSTTARKAPIADTSFKPRSPDEARRAIMERLRQREKRT